METLAFSVAHWRLSNKNDVNFGSFFLYRPHDYIPLEIVSEYGQEIPQSQTADNPVAPRGRAAQPSRDTRKTN